MNQSIVFVPLAMNQTLFYLGVAEALRDLGVTSIFICIHERSHRLLEARGFRSFNFFEYKKRELPGEDFSFSKYGVHREISWLTHEKEAYWIYESKKLLSKFKQSLGVFDEIFAELSLDVNNSIVVQELGGFLSVVSGFFVSQKHGLRHFFVEPSFFKSRCFLIENSFGPETPVENSSPEAESFVKRYLEEWSESRSLIVPDKDKHHFKNVWQKFFRWRNLKRFVQKTWDIYVIGLDEEFRYVGTHFSKNFGAIVNRLKLMARCQKIPAEPFAYFPLHVPADMALTVRAPEYLDQCYLIEQVARTLPSDWVLCIKEHPAMVGAIPASQLNRLMNRNSNVVLLDPGTHNHEVMARAKRVYTINSKAGAEAVALGTPVALFSRAFYEDAPGVTRIDSCRSLYGEICYEAPPKANDVYDFYSRLYEKTYPGELYSLDPENLKTFAFHFKGLF